MYKTLLLLGTLGTSLFGSFFYNGSHKIALTRVADTPPLKNASSKISYFKTPSGERLGVGEKIIVCYKDLKQKRDIEAKYGLESLDKITDTMVVYRFKEHKSAQEVLALANEINTLDGVKFSHPDFAIQKRRRSVAEPTRDPLFWSEWYLDRMDVYGAWHYSRGAGVIVGVYDEGIDLEHEDLRHNIIGFGNYASGYKQLTMISRLSQLRDDDPNAPISISGYWHGTACSGIIAAQADNNRGGVGIAPDTKLIVARYSSQNISDDSKALIDMANAGASIITNSWGTNNMLPSLNETFRILSEQGRDGKGVIVIFAAGNDGCNMDGYYHADADGHIECSNNPDDMPINDESESPYVLSIASTTGENQIADYSNYGSAIDFTAPGGMPSKSIVTTDAMGAKGFGPYNYTPQRQGYRDINDRAFNGTSAAAPMVAGVVALILSTNPSLSKEEVMDILKSTTQKLGRYAYDSNGKNAHWGYGIINAGAAVKLASEYGHIETQNFAKTIYSDLHR